MSVSPFDRVPVALDGQISSIAGCGEALDLETGPNPTKDVSWAAQPIAPFLKWAGGKRWLCQTYGHLFPSTFDRYIEPFLGSAAVFFSLRPRNAVLSDANTALIDTYRAIRLNWTGVQAHLARHAAAHSDDYYYVVRRENGGSAPARAARFLYLNRACWNGLYRVNKQGIFNVPRGTKSAIILPFDNFRATSSALSGVKLVARDFSSTISGTRRGDFLFIDPPYTVAHILNGFIKYNDQIFSWDDQIRLRDAIVSSANKGAKILLTNADHDSVRELYKGIGRHVTLHRSTIISGKTSGRRMTTELAVVIGY